MVGNQIKKYRKINKLSQTELASIVGKDRQYLYKIEKGKVKSNIVTISLLAVALKVSLSELFQDIKILK